MDKKRDRVSRRLGEIVARYRVASSRGFDLESFSTNDLPDGAPRASDAKALTAANIARLSALQELLYANSRWSLLVIFQAMDAGGKDSTIKHVLSGINPQGVTVTSFKAPGPHELAHDFLWRVHRAIPARGMIGVFNRSHYEDVLVSRVHEDLLDATRLPQSLRDAEQFWTRRIQDIAAFEAYLSRQGVRILKIFLNIGRDEQKARLLARMDDPGKRWKFEAADLRERDRWSDYRVAYQAAIAGTATPEAPWFVVPADRKWFARLVVSNAIVAAMEELKLKPPSLSKEERLNIDECRGELSGRS